MARHHNAGRGKGRARARKVATLAEKVGGRVRLLREARGLSLRQAAERTGLEKAQLCKLEYGRTGATGPGVHTLERVCDGLGADIALLFVGR